MKKEKVFKILGGVAIGVGAVAAAPFTGGGSLLAGAAALGLGTTVAVVGAVGAGIAGGACGYFFGKDDKEYKLGLLGMKASGKTTFLNNLRGIKAVPKTTSKESYVGFEFELSSGKTIYIDKGNDMGGDKNYMAEYRHIVEKNDVIVYFFDVCRYLTENEYLRECNSRLDFINGGIKDKKIAIIASHSDLSKRSEEKLIEDILNLVRDKKYSNLFNNGLFVVNLTDDKEVIELIDKIFG